VDYLRFYDLETYLFDDVSRTFAETGTLTPFDILAIGEWKATRARSYFVSRLVEIGRGDMDAGATAIAHAASLDRPPAERFAMLFGRFGFRLPMASAILTVLDPAAFTVYDERVCRQLGSFQNLSNRMSVTNTWNGYQEFVGAVKAAAPKGLNLRDCDRWLWAKDRAERLAEVIDAARCETA
jgi:hypothetical protein